MRETIAEADGEAFYSEGKEFVLDTTIARIEELAKVAATLHLEKENRDPR